MKKILFFGDSLTAGYGLAQPTRESLPALIQAKIDAENLNYKTVNRGISGETSSGGLVRIDSVLHEPIEVFVLELGINDFFRGIPEAVTERNLQLIIDKVVKKNPDAKLVLLGMEVPFTIAAKHGVEFRAIFRRIAEKNNMVFMPFLLHGVAGVAALNLFDGLHPSARGYEVIANNLWEILKPIL